MHRMSLADAVEERDIDAVTAMLHNPIVKQTIEQTKTMGDMGVEMTPLCIAVHLGDFPMVHLLLKNGANVDGCCCFTENTGFTDYKHGCYSNNEYFTNYNRTQTPLATAVQNCDFEMVLLLLETGADVNNNQSTLGMTAIWFVSIHGATRLNVRAMYWNGLHPRSLDMIRLLVGKGADVNIRAINRESLLHFVLEMNMETLFNKCDVIKLLVELGADVNAQDNQGQSVLHLAMKSGLGEEETGVVVHLLAELGADVNTQDTKGQTPLHYASIVGTWGGTKTLIDCGAEIDVQDEGGCTPLHYAASGNLKIVEMLIHGGANINFKDNIGRSPLHHAVIIFDYPEIVVKLILLKANLDIKDVYGRTPLHYTVNGNSSGIKMDTITRMLIQHGADVFAKDYYGQTPTDIESTGTPWRIIKDEQIRIKRFEAFAMAHVDRSSDESRPSEESIVRWLNPDMLRKVLSYA
jgi:ankyrin repeat protein